MFTVIGANSIVEKENKRLKEAYKTWCKLEDRQDVTYEEWENLYILGLLKDE